MSFISAGESGNIYFVKFSNLFTQLSEEGFDSKVPFIKINGLHRESLFF